MRGKAWFLHLLSAELVLQQREGYLVAIAEAGLSGCVIKIFNTDRVYKMWTVCQLIHNCKFVLNMCLDVLWRQIVSSLFPAAVWT